MVVRGFGRVPARGALGLGVFRVPPVRTRVVSGGIFRRKAANAAKFGAACKLPGAGNNGVSPQSRKRRKIWGDV
eukprot:1089792-Pleurochrysis_carterae.AAC.1